MNKMQFTIISDKLPRLSVGEFKHEFRHVHAADTKETASSLGLITQYIQGLYLPSAIDGATQLTGLPLAEHEGSYQSLAQLTWPSVEVLRGSLQSAGYRESAAAKHQFAVPKHLFLTERLDLNHRHDLDGLGRPENNLNAKQRPVVLIAALTPKAGIDDTEFKELWAKHADSVQTTTKMNYRRNAVIPLHVEQLRAVFAGTQFPVEKCCSKGGYEEFVFTSTDDAQSFCNQYGENLRMSYRTFCDIQTSWCAGFDYVEHWGQLDIGLKQRVIGTILGLVLNTKTWLGL